MKQRHVSSATLSAAGQRGKSSGLRMARGLRLVQRLSGPRAKVMLGPAEGPSDTVAVRKRRRGKAAPNRTVAA